MRLDQPLARHDLGQHDLRGAAGDGVDRADHQADDVQPADRQPAGPPGQRHAGDREADHAFADDVDRQLADAVEPDPGRQREQHERHDLHGREQAHLRRRRLQQHRRGERQRQHRHLPAERADEDRGPQAPVGGVAQQVVGGKPGPLRQDPSCHSRKPLHGFTFFFPTPPREAVCGPGAQAAEKARERSILPLISQRNFDAKGAERTRSGRERHRNAGPCRRCTHAPTTRQRRARRWRLGLRCRSWVDVRPAEEGSDRSSGPRVEATPCRARVARVAPRRAQTSPSAPVVGVDLHVVVAQVAGPDRGRVRRRGAGRRGP